MWSVHRCRLAWLRRGITASRKEPATGTSRSNSVCTGCGSEWIQSISDCPNPITQSTPSATTKQEVSHAAASRRCHQDRHKRYQGECSDNHQKFLQVKSERKRPARVTNQTNVRLVSCCANATLRFFGNNLMTRGHTPRSYYFTTSFDQCRFFNLAPATILAFHRHEAFSIANANSTEPPT